MYYVYILECENSLYTGMTANFKYRMRQHFSGERGRAKYTASHPPKSIAAAWECSTKSEALKGEASIKKLSRENKLKLIDNYISLPENYRRIEVPMKNYDVVLFDLDGTVTDPGLGITNSAMYALKKYGIEEKRENLFKFIGPPLHESFEKYYGFTREKAWEAVEVYREYFAPKGLYENEVYEGMEPLLKNLKRAGKKVLLATSKPEIFAVKILEHFGLAKYFDFIGGALLDRSRLNKADVIEYVFKTTGLPKENAIMVGDREHDIIGANAHKIDSVGVLYGYGSKEELTLSGATYIADNTAALSKILL